MPNGSRYCRPHRHASAPRSAVLVEQSTSRPRDGRPKRSSTPFPRTLHLHPTASEPARTAREKTHACLAPPAIASSRADKCHQFVFAHTHPTLPERRAHNLPNGLPRGGKRPPYVIPTVTEAMPETNSPLATAQPFLGGAAERPVVSQVTWAVRPSAKRSSRGTCKEVRSLVAPGGFDVVGWFAGSTCRCVHVC